MSSGAARLLVNAIDAPSGDHSGNASNPTVDVSRVWFEPSASITQMSWNESRALDVYAIAEPSGDQVGQVSCTTGVDVIADIAAIGTHREDVAVPDLRAHAAHVRDARAGRVPVGHRLRTVGGVREPSRAGHAGSDHPDVDLLP